MENTIDTYNERLLLFANRLDNLIEIKEPLINQAWIETEDQWLYVEFNMNCFLELPKVFKEWTYYEPADEVEIKSYPKYLGMVGMIMNFFGLKPKEFIQLFGNKIYSIKNIVENINGFIDNRK